jgi:hypothetical protein
LSPKTLKLLQMHNWEHPVRLYHRLVWQLHRPQSQGSPEGGTVCIRHHRRQTTCPGPLCAHVDIPFFNDPFPATIVIYNIKCLHCISEQFDVILNGQFILLFFKGHF